MPTPRTPRPGPPRAAPRAPTTRTTPRPARRTAYLPVRVTPDELAALEQIAADPTAWPDRQARTRGDALRVLLREGLAARGRPVAG